MLVHISVGGLTGRTQTAGDVFLEVGQAFARGAQALLKAHPGFGITFTGVAHRMAQQRLGVVDEQAQITGQTLRIAGVFLGRVAHFLASFFCEWPSMVTCLPLGTDKGQRQRGD